MSKYRNVLWLNASSTSSIDAGLYEIAANIIRLNEQPEVVQQALRWINSRTNCLIILDNVPEMEVFYERSFVGDSQVGRHILITSRNERISQLPAESLRI